MGVEEPYRTNGLVKAAVRRAAVKKLPKLLFEKIGRGVKMHAIRGVVLNLWRVKSWMMFQIR